MLKEKSLGGERIEKLRKELREIGREKIKIE